MRILPFGSWPSPLDPGVLAAGRVSLRGLWVEGSGVSWWSESRPLEQGRQVVVRLVPGAGPEDVSPPWMSVRTRVHEYGGAAFALRGGELVFVSDDDQALWSCRPGEEARRLSPPAPSAEVHRHAEPVAVPGERWVVCLRERHRGGAVDDEIVALGPGLEEPAVLVSGRDFFAAPRPDPAGARLAWVAWDHPAMPWDSSELWVANLARGAKGEARLEDAAVVAGGTGESVGQPQWLPDGSLLFVSDRSGWWQPYRWVPGAQPERLCAEEADFHAPDWVLGQTTMAPVAEGLLVCRVRRRGGDELCVLDTARGTLCVLDQPFVSVTEVRPAPGGAVAVLGSSAVAPASIIQVSVPARDADGGVSPTAAPGGPHSPSERPDRAWSEIHRAAPALLGPEAVSRPLALRFPIDEGDAHLLFFAPTPASPDVAGPAEDRPPLIVMCHGGPTAGAEAGFDLAVQAWTSRGLAVAVVDYRGSAGHGRAFRDALRGRWGEADAEDCIAAARFLAAQGLADPDRMVVRGSSAGGLTALRCLRAGGPFVAAVVAYGVTDLRSLARDTHKFESHYLDGLVGPWPQAASRYEERSPALHAEEIVGAVLLLQGAEDPIVPPHQARSMADALRRRGQRCDLELLAGEGHGFRRAESLKRAAELELAFVGDVLGIDPGGTPS